MLVDRQCCISRKTYKPPRAKTPIKAAFCFLGISIDINAGMGIIRMKTSVAMCMLAFENQSPGLLKQNPGIESSQNLATGTQFKNALMTAHVP